MNPIRAYREQKGLTQAQLAKALGVHKSTVERWERGISRVPASVLLALGIKEP
jgi:transcriptional regulator with XRE-family HTH domain